MIGFVSWATPLILGVLGAVIGWIGLEFVGKPVRAFFNLKRDSLETLALYSRTFQACWPFFRSSLKEENWAQI
jgi:hypothetical protein